MASKKSSKSSKKSAASQSAKVNGRVPKIHIREKTMSTSDTLCGGSHSDIWKRKLDSVAPQQASKATCGRCKRVHAAREAQK